MHRLRLTARSIILCGFIFVLLSYPVYTQTTLRSESLELSKEELLKEIKQSKLHCPGEKIKGKIKNQFEPVILRDEKIVNDHSTGLMWQQVEDAERFSWKEAEAHIKKMNEAKWAGYSDWRMPTAVELASLLQKKKRGQYYIHKAFKKELLSTWTSDRIPDAFAGAWFVDFMDGKPVDGNRAAGLGHVRLVRSMK